MKNMVLAVIVDESIHIVKVLPLGCDMELGAVQLVHAAACIALFDVINRDMPPIARFMVVGYDDPRRSAFQIKHIPREPEQLLMVIPGRATSGLAVDDQLDTNIVGKVTASYPEVDVSALDGEFRGCQASGGVISPTS